MFLLSERTLFLLIASGVLSQYLRTNDIIQTIVSHGVTFSNQIVGLMSVWMLLSFIMSPTHWLLKLSQEILVLYGSIMIIVFYASIVPLNGMPNEATMLFLIDISTHAVLPVTFIINWYQTRTDPIYIGLLPYLIYPTFYLGFVMWISKRRGYPIYPFLYEPVYLFVVFPFSLEYGWCMRFGPRKQTKIKRKNETDFFFHHHLRILKTKGGWLMLKLPRDVVTYLSKYLTYIDDLGNFRMTCKWVARAISKRMIQHTWKKLPNDNRCYIMKPVRSCFFCIRHGYWVSRFHGWVNTSSKYIGVNKARRKLLKCTDAFSEKTSSELWKRAVDYVYPEHVCKEKSFVYYVNSINTPPTKPLEICCASSIICLDCVEKNKDEVFRLKLLWQETAKMDRERKVHEHELEKQLKKRKVSK